MCMCDQKTLALHLAGNGHECTWMVTNNKPMGPQYAAVQCCQLSKEAEIKMVQFSSSYIFVWIVNQQLLLLLLLQLLLLLLLLLTTIGEINMTTVLAHWELLICSRWVCININPLYSSHVSVENSIITICAVCAKGLCNQSCLCFVFIYNYVTAVCHFASQKCPEKRSSCFPFTFKLTVDCQFTPCWVLLPFFCSCLCAPLGSWGSGSSVRHVARLGYSLLFMHIDMCSGSASVDYSS